MKNSRWQFWIDVGGTFTDCLARRPDGALVRHKLLSSGAVKGSVASGSCVNQIIDPSRRGDPRNFYACWRIRLLTSDGLVEAERNITQFDATTGQLQLHKPLPKDPAADQSYELVCDELPPVIAVRYLLELGLDQAIPPVVMRLGTTRGTNALLTRTGAAVALITTKGFADILRIGYQNRPQLFDLEICKRNPLHAVVLEVDERVSAEGAVLLAPNLEQVRHQLQQLKEEDAVDSLAICLLNAYRFSSHEQQIEHIAREVGFTEISRSSHTAPLIKLVSRGDTTVVDAYLNPVLRDYVQSIRASLPNVDLRILTSAGGLVGASEFCGKDSVLSGPAGGVVGFAAAAAAAGFSKAIGLDMGGTSTDVSRWDGRFDREFETEKAGVRIVAPMMAIETVAAGGGSVCRFDGIKLSVGPESAGANPGPACYGRGGPLSVTDLNFVLGRIQEDSFPFPLDRDVALGRLRKLAADVISAGGPHYEPLELAEGLLQIANANMAQAIRSVSVAKGCDPREYLLVAFGGAAGQHACAIADQLGMRKILSHADAGILSAYGIGMANVQRSEVRAIYRRLDESSAEELSDIFASLTDETVRQVQHEGISKANISVQLDLDLRYVGLDAFLTITAPDDGNWVAAYDRSHHKLYGYTHGGKPLEVVAARVSAVGTTGEKQPLASRVDVTSRPQSSATAIVRFNGKNVNTDLFRREHLRPGHVINGPAILLEETATTIIEPAWQAEMLSDKQLLIAHTEQVCRSANETNITRQAGYMARDRSEDLHRENADPVLLEILNRHFAAIAEQMGITLRNTSSSVNVKERLDFSCAVFTPEGDLVVNAPHIPVHLGAMGLTVRCVLADNPEMAAGDVFVTNDPYGGGSHLPDITVVTPVHNAQGELLFFTASRAHHAEIGGIRAGSMPPLSKNLAEEGVLIRNFKIIAAGRSRLDEFRKLLTAPPYPSRSPDDNLSDVNAQIAANRQGANDLLALIESQTQPVVAAYMRHIQNAAETEMRGALKKLRDGKYCFTDHLDDGSPITVAITIAHDQATIDFNGTGPVLPGNLNANQAIVTAAVMYVLRCLIAEDIPLNEGVLGPVNILLPECLLNPPPCNDPQECAAVAGGNVETSQRVVDALLGALNMAAASCGTMNNLLFGDETFGYYETIGGGSGATAHADGADAVHTHMTNTRLTDPEVLEQRFPIRVREFAIRHGSGGAGRHRGGNGIIRRIEFRQQLEVSILSSRRGPYLPYGLAGAEPGKAGVNTLQYADGTVEKLPAIAQFIANVGDILTLETPGGGGHGPLNVAFDQA